MSENNINQINDELIDKTKELLDIHEKINSELEKEVRTESNLRDVMHESKEYSELISDEKSEIRDINDDIVKSENKILNDLTSEAIALDDIITRRKEEKSFAEDLFLIEDDIDKAIGRINTNLQATLALQQNIASAATATAQAQTSGSTATSSNTSNGGNKDLPFSSPQKIMMNASNFAIDSVVSLATVATQKWREIDNAVFKTGRRIGMASSQMEGMQKNILSNYGVMANKLGMTFEEIFKFQSQYQANIGRNIMLANSEVESMAGLSKIIGESAVNDMAINLDDFGASATSAVDYLTLNMAKASSIGLDLQATGEKFAKNMKLASRYTFRKGVDDISKMTLLSQRLKFNMESIGNAIDKFSTIEGAISTSAQLQVLGGSYAAQFSNPMQAMGEALLDAEGFTKRIVDTFASTAVFNKETGMVNMSAIDKAKMREASKALGISYDEMWNMASQQAKMGSINQATSRLNLDESQKSFLANTAQYDKDRGWYFTKTNAEGKQENIYLNEAKDINAELKEVQAQSDVAKATFGDVHAIRHKLDAYLGQTTTETKTFDEAVAGKIEHVAIEFANKIDPAMNSIKGLLLDGNGILGAILTAIIAQNAVGIGGLLANGGKSVAKGTIGALGRNKYARLASRKLSSSARAFGGAAKKAVPIVGTALAAYDIYNSWDEHNENIHNIEKDKSLSEIEKAQAKYDSKKNRNKEIGATSGALAGGLAGAAIGSAILPGIGTLIGGAIGGLAGHWGGGSIGQMATGSFENSKEYKELQSSNQAANQTVSLQHNNNRSLDGIQEDVRKIRYNLAVSKPINNNTQIYANENHSIYQKPQYDDKTYIKESYHERLISSMSSPTVEKIDLNINGTLRLQSNGITPYELDMKKLLELPEFKNRIIAMVNEGLAKGNNPIRKQDKNSLKSTIGGHYSPKEGNSIYS